MTTGELGAAHYVNVRNSWRANMRSPDAPEMDEDSRMSERPEPYGSAHDLPSFVEMRQQLRLLKDVTRVVMRDKRAEIIRLERQMEEMADRVDAFYDRLGSRRVMPKRWSLGTA